MDPRQLQEKAITILKGLREYLQSFAPQLNEVIADLERVSAVEELEPCNFGATEAIDELRKLGVLKSEGPPTHEELDEAVEEIVKRVQESEAETVDATNAIIIDDDGRCTCTCADLCPLHRTSTTLRCTEEELKAAGVTTLRVEKTHPAMKKADVTEALKSVVHFAGKIY